jgi:small-conductance mechanosensitive channel
MKKLLKNIMFWKKKPKSEELKAICRIEYRVNKIQKLLEIVNNKLDKILEIKKDEENFPLNEEEFFVDVFNIPKKRIYKKQGRLNYNEKRIIFEIECMLKSMEHKNIKYETANNLKELMYLRLDLLNEFKKK